ncbi:conserved Plasmodium protein, unknown function [Plasmodium knowlesi strain H]|uniref:Uncharacterized protein n=3 Tax=Plasmodium knowlesi TaxID=5850 RepID=A0A1A7VVT8_PLAKH|nr:conserved Plasmodium protein, unknown function [Plasmodium knowlesi strain H]OTN63839.1 Uncharacterized protein PKNOH_S140225300 [Plasmodium knowlesi]CAA9990681.1 conserved Plasmodium protein, unknown function [Plasmodium knowlesi strain H]SBO25932.1 conserved Plasmodium protein, unknown function [Plasmodium knowlesi strain H]SBO28677.1 conserved Plasmodium protein, unknown function [Plasmodium knowlesi strain H]VVS80155.1 conserved Plasmodium protein, unknown function [Plasmodium knowlesi 
MYTHMMSSIQNMCERKNITTHVQCIGQSEHVLRRGTCGACRNSVLSKEKKSMRKEGIKINRKYKKLMIEKNRVHKRKHVECCAGINEGLVRNSLFRGVEYVAGRTVPPTFGNCRRCCCNASRPNGIIHIGEYTCRREICTKHQMQNIYPLSMGSAVQVSMGFHRNECVQGNVPLQERGNTYGLCAYPHMCGLSNRGVAGCPNCTNRMATHSGVGNHNGMASLNRAVHPNRMGDYPRMVPPNGMGAYTPIISPNRAVVPSGGVSPNRAVVPSGVVPPNRAVVPSGMVSPNRAVVPSGVVPPNRAVVPSGVVPPNRAVVPSGMVSPNRAVVPSGVVPPNRAVVPSGMVSPNRAVVPSGVVPPNRAVVPSRVVPPNRAVVPSGMACPNRALHPNGMEPYTRTESPNRIIAYNRMVAYTRMLSPKRAVATNTTVVSNKIVSPNIAVVPNRMAVPNKITTHDEIVICNHVEEVDGVVSQSECNKENLSRRESVADNDTAIIDISAMQENVEDSPVQANTQSESTSPNALNEKVAERERNTESANNTDDVLNQIRARYKDFLRMCSLKSENIQATKDEDEPYLKIYNGEYSCDTDYSCDGSVVEIGKNGREELTEEEKFILRQMEEVLKDIDDEEVANQPDDQNNIEVVCQLDDQNNSEVVRQPNDQNNSEVVCKPNNNRTNAVKGRCKRNHKKAFESNNKNALPNDAEIDPIITALENALKGDSQNCLEKELTGEENSSTHKKRHKKEHKKENKKENKKEHKNRKNVAKAESYEKMEKRMAKRQKIFLP